MRVNLAHHANILMLLAILLGQLLSYAVRADDILKPEYGIQIDFFQTPDRSGDTDLVNSPTFDQRFVTYTETDFTFGVIDHDLWFRITLPAGNPFNYLEIDNPYLDLVSLYSRQPDGQYQLQQAGDSLPFNSREKPYRTFIFELEVETHEETVHYLKISSTGATHFLLNVWTEQGFLEYATRSQGLIGLYYGLLLVMAIYNLLIYLSIREVSHLYYVIYIITFGLFFGSISGVTFQYLWPASPHWAGLSTFFFTGLVIFTAFLFTRSFLQSRVNAPRMDRLMLGLMTLAVLEILMSLFGDRTLAAHLAIATGICLPPVIWLSGIVCWLKGYRPARFLIVAWSFFLITIFTSGLMHAGLLPVSFFTVYGMQIGSGIEIILLSWALADKMHLLKSDKEKAQRTYTQHLETYSQILEHSVADRTQELQATMELANQKNQELKLANQHLTELATHDGLTGLMNHHTFIEQFKHVIEDARRYQYSLVVLMIDLDHFKVINDTFGHMTGNEVLKEVAKIFAGAVRESDLAARYGGEEFSLVLTRSNLTEAFAKAELIRQQAKQLRLENAPALNMTISIGVTEFNPSDQNTDYNMLLTQADRALYEAKQSGRDRVCTAGARHLTVID